MYNHLDMQHYDKHRWQDTAEPRVRAVAAGLYSLHWLDEPMYDTLLQDLRVEVTERLSTEV